IQTPQFGMHLDGLLRARAGALTGILNGVDVHVWSPEGDPFLLPPYGIDDAPAGKAVAKAALERRFALAPASGTTNRAPLFGAVTRLTWQKGMDLLLAALPGLVALGARLVLLGSGDAGLEAGFAAAAAAHPGRVGVAFGYDEALSHLIVAGSDAIVVPSRFEPCGLTQLYALRYGALPLVRHTGGLADTVTDSTAANLADGSATGFAFDAETPEALLAAAQRLLGLYRDRGAWRRLMAQAMRRDFSWGPAAQQYLALYRDLAAARSAAH
ncbi:MAG TPA: glycosyltransferase, partial [Stellaceae bacterium]|nr:glycosyltransferase [Stellaceae bacterium]